MSAVLVMINHIDALVATTVTDTGRQSLFNYIRALPSLSELETQFPGASKKTRYTLRIDNMTQSELVFDGDLFDKPGWTSKVSDMDNKMGNELWKFKWTAVVPMRVNAAVSRVTTFHPDMFGNLSPALSANPKTKKQNKVK